MFQLKNSRHGQTTLVSLIACMSLSVLSLQGQTSSRTKPASGDSSPSEGGTVVNGIVATVNGAPITYSEWRKTVDGTKQMIAITYRADPAELKKKIEEAEHDSLDALIDRELVLADFKKLGGGLKAQYLDDDVSSIVREQFKGDRPAFIKELTKAGLNLKQFRELREKALIIGYMRAQKLKALPVPSKEKIQAFYNEHLDDFSVKNYAKISTISIPRYIAKVGSTEATQHKLANEVRSKVASGSDFAAAARTYSSDSRQSAGGEMGWVERAVLDPTMSSVIFKTKAGTVTPVIELPSAYVVCFVEARKPGEVKPLADVKPSIEKALQADQGKIIIDKWIADLRKTAMIKKMN